MLEITLFYIAATIALVATVLAMTRANAIHALIYLIVSLLAVAVIFFLIGAPFAAALEIVIYAGAIMVLFVFVIMMLNLGRRGRCTERGWLQPSIWAGPALLSAAAVCRTALCDLHGRRACVHQAVSAKEVGWHCLGPMCWRSRLPQCCYWQGLVGSFHLGRRYLEREE